MLKLVIEKACAAAKTVLSTVMSPPPPVAVTVPCAWQVVPSEAYKRQCAAVPALSALESLHVPVIALEPLEAADIQSEGRVKEASTVPLSAVAQLAGTEPVRIFNTALVPTAVSMASNLAFRTVTENCKVIFHTPEIK